MRTQETRPTARARLGEHAIVVGAGIAGLLSARVLAEFFERVTLLERDGVVSSTGSGRTPPQGQHVHVLLAAGQRIIDGLFPRLMEDLRARGAHAYEVGTDMRVETPVGSLPLGDLGLHSVSMTRLLLESRIRSAVLERGEVTLRQARVTGPLWQRSRLRGVRACLSRGTTAELTADLVVDASGVSALSSRWLAPAGFQEPELTSVRINARYTTRCFDIPDGWQSPWKLIVLLSHREEDSRGALLVPIEGGRWMVSLSCHGAEAPPGDLAQFRAYARRLPCRSLSDAIEAASPAGKARSHYFPSSLRRHPERLSRHPDGLLAIGDSLTCLNPVYGQGMSAAALEARALKDELRSRAENGEGLNGLGASFYPRCAELIEGPWRLSALPDLACPLTEGERPKDLESQLRPLAALRARAYEDAAARRRLFEVLQLVRPWADLEDPG